MLWFVMGHQNNQSMLNISILFGACYFLPGFHAAGKVDEIGKRVFILQALDGELAADTLAAIEHHHIFCRDFFNMLGDLPQREKHAAYIEGFVFERLPYIYQMNGFVIAEAFFKFGGSYRSHVLLFIFIKVYPFQPEFAHRRYDQWEFFYMYFALLEAEPFFFAQ